MRGPSGGAWCMGGGVDWLAVFWGMELLSKDKDTVAGGGLARWITVRSGGGVKVLLSRNADTGAWAERWGQHI